MKKRVRKGDYIISRGKFVYVVVDITHDTVLLRRVYDLLNNEPYVKPLHLYYDKQAFEKYVFACKVPRLKGMLKFGVANHDEVTRHDKTVSKITKENI